MSAESLMTVYYHPWIQILYRCSAALSIFGSSWILAAFIRDGKKRKMCYHRLLFGMSFFDFLSSIGFFAGTWAQSEFEWGASGSIGNAATCNASGFVIYMGSLAIPWYNAALNVYFYLAVCRGLRARRLKKHFEQYLHMIIFLSAIIAATIPLFFQLYNPYHFFCFITGRSNQKGLNIFFSLYIASVFLCSIIIASTMIAIACRAKKTLNRSESYRFNSDRLESRQSWRRRNIYSEVTIMALLYSIPFVITWLIPVLWVTCVFISWTTSFHIVPMTQHSIHYASKVYISIFVPLQGFFNWLIYMRVRLLKIGSRVYNAGSSVFLRVNELVSPHNLQGVEDDSREGSNIESPQELSGAIQSLHEDIGSEIDDCIQRICDEPGRSDNGNLEKENAPKGLSENP